MTKKYENDIDEGQKMISRNSWNIKKKIINKIFKNHAF